MLVKRRMSQPVITVPPDMSVPDCLKLMQREHIRRTPVVENGRLIGIVSDKDLLNASPSDATSLSVWEITYLINKIKIKDIMTKNVLTIEEDMPIEEAARIMVDNKVGGLPVLRGGQLVGLITETDLFKVLLELMGAREQGVRVTAIVPEIPGELAAITQAVANAGGSFLAFGQFSGESSANRIVTFKVRRLDETAVRAAIEPVITEIIDIRSD
ncbi:MAG: CBS domain-containing protein [Anaerolineaceae bacterium]|nr:CBS domain-containing protein [Anaerolineaceae bacterium]